LQISYNMSSECSISTKLYTQNVYMQQITKNGSHVSKLWVNTVYIVHDCSLFSVVPLGILFAAVSSAPAILSLPWYFVCSNLCCSTKLWDRCHVIYTQCVYSSTRQTQLLMLLVFADIITVVIYWFSSVTVVSFVACSFFTFDLLKQISLNALCHYVVLLLSFTQLYLMLHLLFCYTKKIN